MLNDTSAMEHPSPPEPLVGTVNGNESRTGATTFGRRLRNLRLRIGLSQKQLAHSSTLSVRAIRDLENDRIRQPRADTLRLLAAALGLSASQLHRLADDHSLAGSTEPAMSGPFIGREQELMALTTMLGTEHHRLVTISGIEGVGKTRLALEVAHALEAAEHSAILWLRFDDGQLHSGRKPVEARERPSWFREVLHSGSGLRRRLVETIGDSNGLLVLDGAQPEDEPADLAAELVNACPRLRILVTTRSPLNLPLESLFPLAPLPVPAPDTEQADLDKVPSVALLLAHTKRIQPAFRPGPQGLTDVARICRALDGVPAALESAARWSLIYSPRQLADQLVAEPLTVARRTHGARQQPDRLASVQGVIAALTSRQRALLAAMCRTSPRGQDSYWSVPEVAEVAGLTVAECADEIYHLLIPGLLHRVDHQDVAMFQVLNIVNIARQHTAA